MNPSNGATRPLNKEKGTPGLPSDVPMNRTTNHQESRTAMSTIAHTTDTTYTQDEGHAEVRREALDHIAKLGFKNPDEKMIELMRRALVASDLGVLPSEVPGLALTCPAGLDWCDAGPECTDPAVIEQMGGVSHVQRTYLLEPSHQDQVSIVWFEKEDEAILDTLIEVEREMTTEDYAEVASYLIRALAAVEWCDAQLEGINADIAARKAGVTNA